MTIRKANAHFSNTHSFPNTRFKEGHTLSDLNIEFEQVSQEVTSVQKIHEACGWNVAKTKQLLGVHRDVVNSILKEKKPHFVLLEKGEYKLYKGY